MKIRELLESNTPCAVMQYFESLKSDKKSTFKKFELIYVYEDKHVLTQVLNMEALSFFKDNLDKFNVVIKNNDGCIYEFNEFKKYKETIIPVKR